MAIPTWQGDGLMNLRARCADTVVPTACPEIHSKLILTAMFMSTFQDTGGKGHFRPLQMGNRRAGAMRLCMRENATRKLRRDQAQDAYQE